MRGCSGLRDLRASWESGTLLSGVVAHRDHVREDDMLLVHQGAHQLALLRGQVHLLDNTDEPLESERRTNDALAVAGVTYLVIADSLFLHHLHSSRI